MKKTEDIKNSTEEDQEDEDSCTKRRVRGTSPLSLILIFLPQKIQRNSETRKSKKNIRVRCPTPIPQDQDFGSSDVEVTEVKDNDDTYYQG